MARSKESTQIIKDIQSFMTWMQEAGVYEEYLSPAGKAFLDGIVTADPKFKPELVNKSKYEKEKAIKFKLFGKKLL